MTQSIVRFNDLRRHFIQSSFYICLLYSHPILKIWFHFDITDYWLKQRKSYESNYPIIWHKKRNLPKPEKIYFRLSENYIMTHCLYKSSSPLLILINIECYLLIDVCTYFYHHVDPWFHFRLVCTTPLKKGPLTYKCPSLCVHLYKIVK